MRYFETIFLKEAHDFIENQNQKTRMKILYNIDRASQRVDATLFKKNQMMTYGNLERAVWGLKSDCSPFGTTEQPPKHL
jgi:hypothetical protein